MKKVQEYDNRGVNEADIDMNEEEEEDMNSMKRMSAVTVASRETLLVYEREEL